MHWIALLPPDDQRDAWGWRALQFTPRVAWVDEALLLETGGSARLWGGPARLLRRLLRLGREGTLDPVRAWAQAGTSPVALALLRLNARGETPPADVPGDLPLDTLTAAGPHVALLERMGCRRWGELNALPRGGVARRFGGELLDALDAAWGQRPERYPWLVLPETFDARAELPALATSAPELMWAAQRLLTQMQAWLGARQRGVLALELEWTLDLRRLDGVNLPPTEKLAIRTARPTQDMAHLRRLVGEQLARASLSAPANHLRLRSLETTEWAGASTSLLPEDNVKGERLHQFIERVSVRLGDAQVLVPVPHSDHRPERMQRWVPARKALAAPAGRKSSQQPEPDALFPAWLLPEPQRLEVRQHLPQYGGPLKLLTRLWRMETAWWEEGDTPMRDYFIAESPTEGRVWVYRERPQPGKAQRAPDFKWFLQGLYA